jgi:hypothetical protein
MSTQNPPDSSSKRDLSGQLGSLGNIKKLVNNKGYSNNDLLNELRSNAAYNNYQTTANSRRVHFISPTNFYSTSNAIQPGQAKASSRQPNYNSSESRIRQSNQNIINKYASLKGPSPGQSYL